MKRFSVYCVAGIIAILTLVSGDVFAGNDQRAGQAGAGQLLINPWARSSGWACANSATIKGLEAVYLNIAGTAFTKKTELIFARTNYLVGTGINMNTFGLSQKLGEAGVLSLALVSMNFGDIEKVTVNLPEGGSGKFSPRFTNITVGFAKEFSNSIYGGVAIKVLNEGISNLTANGVAFDAGIQYVTGLGKNKLGKKKRDNLKFGISMKNVGPTMKYKGDGLSFRGMVPTTVETIMTVESRSSEFELPSLIKIGAAYDIFFLQKVDTVADKIQSDHRVTLAVSFTSNSFTRDQFHFGMEYSFKDMVMLRGGYVYEKEMSDPETRMTLLTGPTAGLSVAIPLSKEKGSYFSIDYSYRFTQPFDGIHSVGAKVSL